MIFPMLVPPVPTYQPPISVILFIYKDAWKGCPKFCPMKQKGKKFYLDKKFVDFIRYY